MSCFEGIWSKSSQLCEYLETKKSNNNRGIYNIITNNQYSKIKNSSLPSLKYTVVAGGYHDAWGMWRRLSEAGLYVLCLFSGNAGLEFPLLTWRWFFHNKKFTPIHCIPQQRGGQKHSTGFTLAFWLKLNSLALDHLWSMSGKNKLISKKKIRETWIFDVIFKKNQPVAIKTGAICWTSVF